VGADIAFDADPKFFACLVRFESSSVPTTLPTAYDVYPLDGRHDGGYYTVKDCVTIDISLRSSRSSYFATFRHQLTILSKTDALDEEKWLNMLGTFVKDWFRYESHFVHGRDSLVDILKERGLLSESDAVQPLIGKKS